MFYVLYCSGSSVLPCGTPNLTSYKTLIPVCRASQTKLRFFKIDEKIVEKFNAAATLNGGEVDGNYHCPLQKKMWLVRVYMFLLASSNPLFLAF